MALKLAEEYPEIDFAFVCTPTGDEFPDMVAHWVKLKEILGKPILPLPTLSLRQACDQNNRLPNFWARFCTRQIKIEPFLAYLLHHRPARAYIGLRADEEARAGAIYGEVDDIEQVFPLQNWGMGINQVIAYLEEKGVTIPRRTDCARCFFQKLSEWHDLWTQYPDIYEDAVQQEKHFGHTFRSAQRDTWPTSLDDLRAAFKEGRIPPTRKSANQGSTACRICTL